MELGAAHIHSTDGRGLALQEAVSEAARRRANIEAAKPGNINVKGIERGLQLESAPAHIARRRDYLDRRGGVDHRCRLYEHGRADTYLASHDEASC
jgi:hypothetical protein